MAVPSAAASSSFSIDASVLVGAGAGAASVFRRLAPLVVVTTSLLQLANVSVGDAAADLREALVPYDHVPTNIEELTSNTPALCVQYKRHGMKNGPAPSVSSKIYSQGLHAWNDPFAIAEEKASEAGAHERTVGVIVKASDLLSRSNAMVNGLKPWSRAPIAKRPPAARKTVGGKKKPCKIA